MANARGDVINVFDRRLVRRRRDRAAAGLAGHDFLFREVAARLADRLDDIRRRFPLALDLGCHDGTLGRALAGKGGIETLVQGDLSPAMAALARAEGGAGALSLALDEEAVPFADMSFDAVFSNLSLHWVNDLPGALLQLRRVLKPDGLLLAAMFGGGTLAELRQCLIEAEIDTAGGAGPRVSPFADLGDAGGLLQRAGFALPVVDTDTVSVIYADLMALMHDLRGMGESNALRDRPGKAIRRDTLARAAEIYHARYADADGRLPATFQVLTLTAWAPDPSQQQALRPGSAKARLADALDAKEVSAGEKAAPE
ncbi:MAG: methyltransferase domain-containing protein [Kiloniellales bacterium]